MVPRTTEPFKTIISLQQSIIGCTFAAHLGIKCQKKSINQQNTRDYAERTEHRDTAESD